MKITVGVFANGDMRLESTVVRRKASPVGGGDIEEISLEIDNTSHALTLREAEEILTLLGTAVTALRKRSMRVTYST